MEWFLEVKRVVTRPKKMGHVQHSEYIDKKNEVMIFMHMYLHDIQSKWHQIYCVEVPSTQGKLHYKFNENLFQHSCKQSNFWKNFFLFYSHTQQKLL